MKKLTVAQAKARVQELSIANKAGFDGVRLQGTLTQIGNQKGRAPMGIFILMPSAKRSD